ncbi:MAG: class I SAM-dependent methyltransferase [Patescibacteria group bacterium]
MDQNRLTEDDIEQMSYTDFIALLDETNRCPGGKKTIRRIRELIHIDGKTNILDVGSNTGFTSLELARITPAKISGIDISESCVDQAKRSLSEDIENVRSRVTFQIASSYSIPFPDDNFDLIMTGGATGFMDDKSRAIHEYLRVLKPWGFLVMSPLTYHTQAPQKIIDDVGEIIGTTIKPMTTQDWVNIVGEISKDFEFYFSEPYRLSPRTNEEVDAHVDYFLRKDRIKILSETVRDAIKRRWWSTLKVFNENHKYLGYSIIVFRKRSVVEEPELFIST